MYNVILLAAELTQEQKDLGNMIGMSGTAIVVIAIVLHAYINDIRHKRIKAEKEKAKVQAEKERERAEKAQADKKVSVQPQSQTMAQQPAQSIVGQATQPRSIPLHRIEPSKRQHTIIAGRTGDGKTVTGITMIVADIVNGAQVAWLNPQLSLYHPDDQRIDLRPIKHLIERYRKPEEILDVLNVAKAIIEHRNQLYEDGQSVGHNIVLHIDEWPLIRESNVGDQCAEALRTILRTGRKCNVWIALATQDAQVETIGLNGGVRNSFATALIGNVDTATWRAMLGADTRQNKLPQGVWQGKDSLITVSIPEVNVIQKLAESLPTAQYAPLRKQSSDTASTTFDASVIQQSLILAKTDTVPARKPDDDDTVHITKAALFIQAHINEHKNAPSARAVAVHIYGDGNGRYNQKAKRLMTLIAERNLIAGFEIAPDTADNQDAQELVQVVGTV